MKKALILIVLLLVLALLVSLRFLMPIANKDTQGDPTAVQSENNTETTETNTESASLNPSDAQESNASEAVQDTQSAPLGTGSTVGGNAGTNPIVAPVPTEDPNIPGDISPDMTIEEEYEVPVESGSAGGLM